MEQTVIKTGGKQYLVTTGQKLRVEKLPGEEGSTLSFKEILLLSTPQGVKVGTPTVSGGVVEATIAKQGRAKKVIVQKYKPKVRYRKKMGHRQLFTEITIGRISG